jgi:hypothetical protein
MPEPARFFLKLLDGFLPFGRALAHLSLLGIDLLSNPGDVATRFLGVLYCLHPLPERVIFRHHHFGLLAQ